MLANMQFLRSLALWSQLRDLVALLQGKPGSLSLLHREENQWRAEEKGEVAGGILRSQLEVALD